MKHQTEVARIQEPFKSEGEVKLDGLFYPNAVARMAENIVTRWAQVAAVPDGEDSSGRQKMRLPTAEELAVRACDIAEAVWLEFQKRDWLMALPLVETDKPE